MNSDSHTPGGVIIEVDGITRRFGEKTALNNVTLNVRRGQVFGLVGENGAGKTTLIKHILGLLKPETGALRVLGKNPIAEPEYVLSRIGYLSEDRDIPRWMRVREVIRYLKPFYPNWDSAYAYQLCERFDLDPDKKIKHLSKGQTAQVGLVGALSHRPPLLVLDEPSSGLDPVVRHDILEAVIRTISEEGRTVFFSSHLLDEVERVCDQVAMLHEGRVLLNAPLERILAGYRLLNVESEKPLDQIPELPSVVSVSGHQDHWSILHQDGAGGLNEAISAMGGRALSEREPSLEEVFVAMIKTKHSLNTGS